ncbi:Rid family detoxifying hydrolase [Microlunatus flavus]|uniref:2-iminobutanoate/2-iminopropanoate deaminase n=1 Tax=Microlunatus flavus TaxID=1036181 RepID=A0A1H9D3X6_9ACTN|nr:Rid family detoxifying hydrolase [Microlunatus flavus]SEQ08144.1 2-iminobutanoate/2-iminopropanoate deaminase [Microlunatus flavus]
MSSTPAAPPGGPEPLGPYSPSVLARGELTFVSGQTPVDPTTGRLVEGDFARQVEQAFANVSAVLATTGLALDQVVKVTVFLRSMDDFAALNAAYERVFTPPYPARTTVAVAGLPLDARVEIEVFAARG